MTLQEPAVPAVGPAGFHPVTVAMPGSEGAQLPEIGWPSAIHVPTFPLPDQA